MTLSVEDYRRAPLSLLPNEERHSAERREQALEAIQAKLREWARKNPQFDLPRQLDALDQAFAGLAAETAPAPAARPVPAEQQMAATTAAEAMPPQAQTEPSGCRLRWICRNRIKEFLVSLRHVAGA